MKAYRELTRAERQTEYAAVRAAYDNQKAQGLKLNMARGKPGRDQLDLVTPMLSLITRPEDFGADGIEERNYGEVAGLPEAKALFAEILGCKSEQVFVGGNASLQLMYDAISKAFTHGLLHSEQLVTITKSASSAAILPMTGRFVLSRSPPQPKSTTVRPLAKLLTERRTFSSASGLWE